MEFKKLCHISLATSVIGFAGCHESMPPQAPTTSIHEATKPQPTRIAAPEFFVSNQDHRFATVIVPRTTSDNEIANLIWLLRDATHARNLNSLGISETFAETRDPMFTVHIYRGVKCADRQYRNHKPPCAFGEQEAAIYQYGNFRDRNADAAMLFHNEDESKEEDLWPIDSPYTPKPNIVPSAKMTTIRFDEQPGTWGSVAQRRLAADYTSQVWDGGLHAAFSTTEKPGELKMSADWLVDEGARKTVALAFRIHREEACAAGFRSVRMTSFPSDLESAFPLNCPSA